MLDADRQEELKRRSSQQLIAPWAIDENEPLTYGSVAYPRSRSVTVHSGSTLKMFEFCGGLSFVIEAAGALASRSEQPCLVHPPVRAFG